MEKGSRREDILNSALRLFLEKGFNATSIEEITRLAGMSKGSFYTYFHSKEELLNEVIRLFLDAITERFSSFLEGKSDKPVEALRAFFDLNLELAKEYASSIFTLIREVRFAPIQTRERLTVSFSKLVEERIRRFIYTIKGTCDESDVIILLGTIVNFWIKFIFGENIPSSKELSERIWFGLGYSR